MPGTVSIPLHGEAGEPGFSPVHATHDYAQAAETRTFHVPNGSGPMRLHAFVEGPRGASACTGSFGLRIEGPSGKVLDWSTTAGSSVQQPGSPCHDLVDQRGVLPAGTWTIAFSGSGTGVGVVDVAQAG
jgi:hypothetical protein